ncbi:hypothetical protein RRG08_025631 [Elysia crispata]|uniref:Uncharacterized protein n=1 Tax=Elysia crispata TaxID=231223 RepID=A0AAE0YFW5_9GAST|nr:hypothetical protein RRG08_025631 [Elysia crispata]
MIRVVPVPSHPYPVWKQCRHTSLKWTPLTDNGLINQSLSLRCVMKVNLLSIIVWIVDPVKKIVGKVLRPGEKGRGIVFINKIAAKTYREYIMRMLQNESHTGLRRYNIDLLWKRANSLFLALI